MIQYLRKCDAKHGKSDFTPGKEDRVLHLIDNIYFTKKDVAHNKVCVFEVGDCDSISKIHCRAANKATDRS